MLAASAAALIASPIVALAGLQAPVQAAVPGTLICNTATNAPTFQSEYTSTNTLTITPSSATPGTPLTLTYQASAGLTNASPTTLGVGTAQPLVFLEIEWTGAPVGKTVASTEPGTYPSSPIASGDNVGAFTATATINAAGDGTATARIRQLVINGGLATYCSPVAGNFPPGTAPTAGEAGFPNGMNENYPDSPGSNINGQYQAFRASGGPVVIRVPETAQLFAEATAEVGVPTPSIALEKEAVTTSFTSVGDEIEYEFNVTNDGSLDLTDVAIDDPKIDTVDCSSVPSPFEPGDAGSCTGTYEVTADDVAAGVVDNTATASAVADEETVESDPSTASVEIATPEIALTKSAEPSTYSFEGDVITFTLDVQNSGDFELTGVEVLDDTADSLTCPAAAETLSVGESASCTATYAVTADDIVAEEFTNTATASGDFDGETITSEPATATVTYVAPIPAVSLEKTANVATFGGAGETIEYTFTIENSGEVPLSEFSIDDPLIPSVDCSSITAPLAPAEVGTCTGSYTTTEADVTAGEVTNTATASADTGGITVEGEEIASLAVINSPVASVTVTYQPSGPVPVPEVTEILPLVYCDTTSRTVAQTPAGITPSEDWPVTLTVSPAAAPPGQSVQISVELDASPINVGPSTLAPNATRFDATVLVDGVTRQLVGPTNAAEVGPFDGVLFPPAERPMVATGTAVVPDTEGLVEVVLQNLWFNSLNPDVSGNGEALTGVFDLVCNTSEDPAGPDAEPIGTTVTFLADADAPDTGVTPDPDPTDPTNPVTEPTTDTSGAPLPQTGVTFGPSVIAALVLLQLGLILAVRSVRATPRRVRLHA
jgi:uncharacterized repeat protein (TIGR01451 family)